MIEFQNLVVNEERIYNRLSRLAEFTSIEGEITRQTWTKAWYESTGYIRKEMEKEGLEVRMDGIGNVIGIYNPKNLKIKPVGIGSHLDTVVNGGAFDGAAGIMAGLEVIASIRENQIEVKRPIEIIAFAEEEGGIFGKGCLGSDYMIGKTPLDQLRANRNEEDENIVEILAKFGLSEEKFVKDHGWASEYYQAFFEVHVEQGPTLEANEKSIGVVQGVVGISRVHVTFIGEANHAGTTPMAVRRDASVAMADFVKEVWNHGQKMNGKLVATTGNIKIWPNQHNVIPGKSNIILELRGDNDDTIMSSMTLLKEKARDIAGRYDVDVEFSKDVYTPVIVFEKEVLEKLKHHTSGMKDVQDIFSWAGHDAKILAEKSDVAMLFVPSVGGVSHSPKEYSREEDLAKAVGILILTLAEI